MSLPPYRNANGLVRALGRDNMGRDGRWRTVLGGQHGSSPAESIYLAPFSLDFPLVSVEGDGLITVVASIWDRNDRHRRSEVRAGAALSWIRPRDPEQETRYIAHEVRNVLKRLACHEIDECIVDGQGRILFDPHGRKYDGAFPGEEGWRIGR